MAFDGETLLAVGCLSDLAAAGYFLSLCDSCVTRSCDLEESSLSWPMAGYCSVLSK